MAATIDLSYQRLNPSKDGDALALALLQRAAQLAPAPIPHRLLVRLAAHDPDDEGQAAEGDAPLRRLAAVGLLELLPEGGTVLHRLVAAFVRAQDAEAQERVKRTVAAGLIAEVAAINTADYPLRGTPYLVHLAYLSLHEDRFEAEQAATLQANLGALLQDQGDLAGARPYYARALAIFEQVRGPQHPHTNIVQGNLDALDTP